MKNKYMVMKDGPTNHDVVKVFRRQSDAMEFIGNPKNTRIYGSTYLVQQTNEGETFLWDDHHKEWQKMDN